MIETTDHQTHHFRRRILGSYFSKRSISDSQPLIQQRIEQLLQKLEEAHNEGSVVNLTPAFAALTAEVISHYAYGRSFGFLEDDFGNILSESVQTLGSIAHLLRFPPFSLSSLKKIPLGIVQRLFPKGAAVLAVHKRINEEAVKVLRLEHTSTKATIFRALTDPALPAEERTLSRLEDEEFVVLGAGTETISHALSVTMFHILDNEDILSQLHEEIKTVMPLPSRCPALSELETLPLLVGVSLRQSWSDNNKQRAVINEGLRLSIGTFTRHPRIAPDTVLKYKDWIIPAGVSTSRNISQASYFWEIDFKPLRKRLLSVKPATLFIWIRKYFPTPMSLTLGGGFARPSKGNTLKIW